MQKYVVEGKMQLQAPQHTTSYYNVVLVSLHCGKKQRPCKPTQKTLHAVHTVRATL